MFGERIKKGEKIKKIYIKKDWEIIFIYYNNKNEKKNTLNWL